MSAGLQRQGITWGGHWAAFSKGAEGYAFCVDPQRRLNSQRICASTQISTPGQLKAAAVGESTSPGRPLVAHLRTK